MSSGRQHFLYGTVVAGGAVGAMFFLTDLEPELLVAFGIGSGAGLLVTPDLDLVQITYTERLARRIPVLGLLLVASGLPYGMLFRHRGISHHPIWGTLSRWIYVVLVFLFWLVWMLGLMWIFLPDWVPALRLQWDPAYLWLLGFFCLGWWVQDLTHLLADWVYSGWRRRQRRRWQRWIERHPDFREE